MGVNMILARCFSVVLIMILTTNAQVCGDGLDINISLLHTAVPKGAVHPHMPMLRELGGSGSKNWMVYMEGGGWCVSKKDCLNRSTGYFGSSFNGGGRGDGIIHTSDIFQSDPRFNPYFYNWHRVYIHYCDGSVFMSDIEQIDPGTNLWFRGDRIYKAMMEEMLTKGMGKAENAILTGSSAGGLATILHCDRFRALFANTTRVKCISDSGFFIRGKGQFANLSEHHFDEVITTHKLAKLLPASCTSKRERKLCLFPEYLVGDVKTLLFLVESVFDSFQIDYDLKNSFGGSTVWKNCTLIDLKLCNPTQLGILKGHTHITQTEGWTCSSVVGNNVLAKKTIGQAIADWFFDQSSFREIDHQDLPRNCSKTISPQLLEDKCLASVSHNNGSVQSYILGLFVFICACIL